MTPSVTEYHFFFLTNEAEETARATGLALMHPGMLLKALLQYLEQGRLQVLTLQLREQFPPTVASLVYHQLTMGALPARPASIADAMGYAARLLGSARPAWQQKAKWSTLQSCTIQSGSNETMRLFIRAEESSEKPESLLIHGTLGEMPGKVLMDSLLGRQLIDMARALLPGERTHRKLELLSGSRVHIERLDTANSRPELQPLLVIRATAQ